MEVKFGKLYPQGIKASSFNTPIKADVQNEKNIFSGASNLPKTEPEKPVERSQEIQNGMRLNDLDANILENNAYQDIPDEILKLEHKMDIAEKELSKITQEIDTLGAFETTVQIDDLIERKKILEKEIENLNKKYAEYGISTKISGQIASLVRLSSNKKTIFSIKTKKIIINTLTKLSKKFKCSRQVKDALDTLSNINSDVDELVKLKVPYGEKIARYDRLTAYLNRANVIHAQISKDLKTLKK